MQESSYSFIKFFDLGYTVGCVIKKKSAKWANRYYCAMTALLCLSILLLIYIVFTNQFLILFEWPVLQINSFLIWIIGTSTLIDAIFSNILSYGIVLLAYGIYLSFPASVLFLLLKRSVVDSRPVLKSPPKDVFFKYRARAPKDAYFAGINAVTGAPIYVSDEARMEHTQIVGVTGGGKTEGGVIPPIIHDIAWGRGAIIVDMKGDRALLDKITAAVVAAGRKDDLLVFALADPEASNTYNPLYRGNASEIKDKLISSNIWSEVYYKKTSEIALLTICHALKLLNKPITFKSLLQNIRDVKKIEELKKELDRNCIEHNISSLLGIIDNKTRDLAGLIADLSAIDESDFGQLLSPDKGEIDLFEAYLNNKIVLFQLNTGLYQETAVRLARIIIQDIKSVSNFIQSYTPPTERHFFSVFIDEFASIAFEAFIELISKARSSKIAISIAHQSLGDLKSVGEAYQNQIFDNTNTRLVYRQNSAESRDLITKMAGTIEKEKHTYQVNSDFGVSMNTGMGSVRRVETFKIDPNLVTEFSTGYCALLQHQKSGEDRVHYMKSDYFELKLPMEALKRVKKEFKIDDKKIVTKEAISKLEKTPELDSLKRYMGLYQ